MNVNAIFGENNDVLELYINGNKVLSEPKGCFHIQEDDIYDKGIKVIDIPENVYMSMCYIIIGKQLFKRDNIIDYSIIRTGKSRIRIEFNQGHYKGIEIDGYDVAYYYKRLKDVVIRREARYADVRFSKLTGVNDINDEIVHISFYSEIECSLLDDALDFAQAISDEIITELNLALGKKIRYIGSIDNEIDFTKEVVIPLLRKLDFTNVKYTHGTSEHGKDITFVKKTEFDELEYWGAQVKFGDIKATNVSLLVDQIMRAFTVEFQDMYGHKINGVSKLVIITSGKFTKQALDAINGRIEQKAIKNNLIFIDGEKIVSLIDKVE